MTPQIEFDCPICGAHRRVVDYQAPGSRLPDCCRAGLRQIAQEVMKALAAVTITTAFRQKVSDALITHPNPNLRKVGFRIRNEKQPDG